LNIGCISICQGENLKKPGAPHNVRLYSIASTRYGDNFDGKTASLCVRRAVYYDPETGKEDPSKNGVCSNFLCNSKPGDRIQVTGNFLMNIKGFPVYLQCSMRAPYLHITISSSDYVHLWQTIHF
jgi:sulfite reductase alpha subunit-like flavoprotein